MYGSKYLLHAKQVLSSFPTHYHLAVQTDFILEHTTVQNKTEKRKECKNNQKLGNNPCKLLERLQIIIPTNYNA